MIWQKVCVLTKVLLAKIFSSGKNQDIGIGGENAVAAHVKNLGMRILYRNWRHESFELDMVCEDAEGIIFVEVKTRKLEGMTSPFEGMSVKKRTTIIRAANVWLRAHSAFEKPCRFAVATVNYTINPKLKFHVEFYDHAFTAHTNIS